MKKNVIASILVATMISAMAMVGCGSQQAQEVAEQATEQVQEATEAVSEAQEAVADAAEAVSAVAEEVEEYDPEAELEAIKETLVYMGGLYISDPENDLMLSLFKNDGLPVAVVTKKGDVYYGEFTTEDGKLEDGREYVKLLVDNKEFGYHFHLEDGDEDSFLVDEDGTVYPAKDIDESVAYDMVLKTLQ